MAAKRKIGKKKAKKTHNQNKNRRSLTLQNSKALPKWKFSKYWHIRILLAEMQKIH